MSTKSNDQGRAFEYACIHSLLDDISKTRKAKIEKIQVIWLQKMHGFL